MSDLCSCQRCVNDRVEVMPTITFLGPNVPGWRYNCHICGNKRCPHHADHRFQCTNDNSTDQVGILISNEE